MKLFLITSSTNSSGGSRQALYLAQGLAHRGHDLTFFIPKGAELPSLAPTLDWRELPESRMRWRKAVASALPWGRPFVLHAFHNKAVKRAAWWGLFWRRRGCLMVAQRGVVFKPNNPLPYLSPGIDLFVANSQACAMVLRTKGVRPDRLRVVLNAIPQERVTPVRPPVRIREVLGLPPEADSEFIFGCVANDSPNKGAALLLRAFAAANLAGTRLLLLGVSPEAFTPLCQELDIADKVSLPGRTEHVADMLQLCQAFVLPSFSESMPNTLQEAICMGLPVIASAVGGVPECVQGNGLLIPPGDEQALTQALQRMRQAGQEREQWAAASRGIAELFSLPAKVERMEALYLQYMRARGLAS